MTTVGPRQPDAETLDEYVQRVIRNAGHPSQEEYAHLAALLGFGAHDGGEADG